MGAYSTTAFAAPVFDDPINYIISNTGNEVVGGQISDIATADFNGDGFLDIAGTVPLTYYDDNGIPNPHEGVAILINDGDGTFAVPYYITYEENLTSIVAGDFDNDGDADLATANNTSDDLAILLNDGNGGFIVTSRLETMLPEKLVSFDFDDDGDLDLAATVSNGTQSDTQQGNQGVQIFLNDNSGNFTLSTLVRTSSTITDFTAADFDGDSDVDLVAGNRNVVATYTVMLNEGNGVFITSEISLLSEDSENSPQFDAIISGDIDSDGDIDVIATLDGSQAISHLTLVNDGTGSFALGQTLYFGNPGPLAVFDLDNDGDIDIVTSNAIFLTNNGQGFFTQAEESVTIPSLSYVTSLQLADLNNDNKNDLIISSMGQLGIWVILHTATENPTPIEQAGALIADVIGLDILNNLENSYLANLFKVEGFIESGQTTPAINQLNAFINKVNQDYSHSKLTKQVRDSLVAAAQKLIDDLTN